MTMQCAETQRFIDAYIDGEFDASDRAEIERHVAGCERCRVDVERQRVWKSALRARLARPVAPYTLHRRVREALDEEELPEPLWRRMAFRLTPAVLVSAALAALILRPAPSSSIVRESVLDHELNLPVEVSSPDPRLVGNWFQGKVAFPVRPPQLGEGAYLLGGRVGSLGRRHAAYLVYAVPGGHKVSVFVFDPDEALIQAPRRVYVRNRIVYVDTQRGYHVALFQEDGIGYAMASDLDEPQMIRLLQPSLGP